MKVLGRFANGRGVPFSRVSVPFVRGCHGCILATPGLDNNGNVVSGGATSACFSVLGTTLGRTFVSNCLAVSVSTGIGNVGNRRSHHRFLARRRLGHLTGAPYSGPVLGGTTLFSTLANLHRDSVRGLH